MTVGLYQKQRREFGRPCSHFSSTDSVLLEPFLTDERLRDQFIERNPSVLDVQAIPEMSEHEVRTPSAPPPRVSGNRNRPPGEHGAIHIHEHRDVPPRGRVAQGRRPDRERTDHVRLPPAERARSLRRPDALRAAGATARRWKRTRITFVRSRRSATQWSIRSCRTTQSTFTRCRRRVPRAPATHATSRRHSCAGVLQRRVR